MYTDCALNGSSGRTMPGASLTLPLTSGASGSEGGAADCTASGAATVVVRKAVREIGSTWRWDVVEAKTCTIRVNQNLFPSADYL